MYIKLTHDEGVVLFQWRLCCECTRMFSLNANEYLMFTFKGMVLHRHWKCPSLKEGPVMSYKLEKS